MKKKWFGLLFVLATVLCLLPVGAVPAFASSDEPQVLTGTCYFENKIFSGYRQNSLFKVTEDTSYTTFYNCTFIDVSSDSDGSCFYFDSTVDYGANLFFKNCRFINCHSGGNGGVFYLYEATGCELHFTDCIAINCSAENGGFLYVDDEMGNGEIDAENFCAIDCKAEEDGGFLCINDNDVQFEGNGSTVISGCFAGDEGGAVYSGYYDGIRLKNISFADNRAETDGGAVYDNSDGSVIENCRFYRNTAGDDGGAVYIDDGDGTVKNCAFFDNDCTDEGKELYSESSGTQITGCVFTDTHDVSSRIESGVVSGCAHRRPCDFVLDPAFAGTEDDPYPIRTVDDWDTLCYVNENVSLRGKYFRLENDLTVCTPLGRYGNNETDRHPFEGSLDGNGKKTVFCSGDGGDHRGLIGYASGNAVIRDLTVYGSVTGSASVGGIVGYAENCRLLGCINYAEVSGRGGVGGIVGCAAGGVELINCVNYGAVSSTQSGVGGIVGKSTGGLVLKNCVSCGKITHGASGFDAILGTASDGVTAENCYYQIGCCDASAYGVGLSENAMTGKAADHVDGKDLIMPDVLNVYSDENRICHEGIFKFDLKKEKLARGKLIYFTADALPQTWGEPGVSTVCILTESAAASERIKVLGEVTLILRDGCTLTASRGITLEAGNTLIVHGYSDDPDVMGRLIATADTESGDAGIGGVKGRDGQVFRGEHGPEACAGEAGTDCGTMLLYGGYVSASGEVGFGGGRGGKGSNGPEIYSNGADGGKGGNGGTLSVFGGRFAAQGTVCAIDGGEGGAGGPRGINEEGHTASSTHDGYQGSHGSITALTFGVNVIKIGNDRQSCDFTDMYRFAKYCEAFRCDHVWKPCTGTTHRCDLCGMTVKHTDRDGDRVCDLCEADIRVTVRYHTENGAACAFEVVCSAGDVLWDRIGERVLALQKGIAGQLYADGSLMETGDLILTEEEYLDLYAVYEYRGAAPTCTAAGRETYYYSVLSGAYCADAACKQTVGDGEALKAWLSLTGAGYIAPLGHTDADFDGKCDVCKDLFCGHENVEVYYGWDIIRHAYCDAVLHCLSCGLTHTERSAKVDLIEEIAGKDCLTKGKKTYRATFPTVESAETTEYTALGDHVDGDRNGWCDICGVFAVKNCKVVTESTSVLAEGNWIVNKSVQFDAALTVSGSVTLYLADDTVLTATCGILLTQGNSLTVCAQSDGDRTGVIEAGGALKGAAGIGGDFFDPDAGELTVNGGHIIAAGGIGAAGIGGGFGGNGGSVTVNGGIVEATAGTGATAGQGGAGIGGGYNGTNGIITVNNVQKLVAKGGRALGAGLEAAQLASSIRFANGLTVKAGNSETSAAEVQEIGDESFVIVTPKAPSFEFNAKNLALESDLAFRFKGYIRGTVADGAYMEFSVGNIRTVTVPLAEATTDELGRTVFTCHLNVLELDEKIGAVFHNGTETVERADPLSVSDYLALVAANHAAQTAADEKILALVDAIRNYAHYAQAALDETHTEYEVGEGKTYHGTAAAGEVTPLTEEQLAALKAQTAVADGYKAIKVSSRSLILDDKTAIVIYLTPAQADYIPTVKVTNKNGADVAFTSAKQEDGRWKIVIPDLAAHRLGDTFTVNVDNGGIVYTNLSALSYAQSVYANGKSENYKLAVSALYAYYKATLAYME